MRVLPLAILLTGSISAVVRADHGSQGSSNLEDFSAAPSQRFDGVPLVMPGTAASREAAAKALPPVPAKKPAPKVPGIVELDEHAPLLILAIGVDDVDGHSDEKTVERAKVIRRTIAMVEPTARVLEVYPLTLKKLSEAWAEVRKRERFIGAPASALVIVDTALQEPTGAVGVDPLLGTSMGPVRWSDFADAMRRLDQTVFPETLAYRRGLEPRSQLETAILGNFAGQIDCDRAPGPVFGATANYGTMAQGTFQHWNIERRTVRELPLSAEAFFRTWNESAQATESSGGSRGFLCRHREVTGAKVVVRPWFRAASLR